jgi:integrase
VARERERPVRVAEGIYKRGGRYLVPIYHPPTAKGGKGSRKWHTLPTGTTLAGAKKAKRELEESKSESTAAKVETVGEFAGRWNEAFPGRKASTIRHNDERIKPFVRDFGARSLDSITPKEARLWVMGGTAPLDLYETAKDWDGAQESRGSLTVPAHIANHPAVRALMGDAQRAGIVNGNPFSNMRIKQAAGRRNIEVLTAAEVDTLANTAKRVYGEFGDHFSDLILTAAWTGLRPGELFALIPERVDLEAGTLHVVESSDNKYRTLWEVKTEAGADREIVLLPKAHAALKRVLEVRAPGEFLFQPPRPTNRWHEHGKAAFGGEQFSYYWRPVRDAFTAQLPATHWLPARVAKNGINGKITLYEMRHAFGTRLAEQGVPAEDIARLMGHADGGVLAMRTYIHVSREHTADRVRKLFGLEAA